MMDNKEKEKEIFYLFEGSLILKGIYATIETIGGLLILFISQNFIVQTILNLTEDELGEDPKDFIASRLAHVAQNFTLGSKHFITFYLLSHGIINGMIVYSLLKKKLWAYPVAVFVFSIFIIYQIFRYTDTHSIWLIIFTIFDFLRATLKSYLAVMLL